MQRRTGEKFAQLARVAEGGRRCIVGDAPASRQMLRRLASRGEILRVGPNLYSRTSYWNSLPAYERTLHKMRALQFAHPDWVFCTTSAALLHGLSLPFEEDPAIHAATHIGSTSSTSSGVTRHPMPQRPSVVIDGIRATSLEETAIDCLRVMDFDRGLALADSVLRITGLSRRDLLELVDRLGTSKMGIDQARMTASWADGRAENGGESIARANMIRLGFVVPELQVPIADPLWPTREYYADYGFVLPDGGLVAGELDGVGKYWDDANGPEYARRRERRREALVTAQGFKVMRFSLEEATDHAYLERLMTTYGIPRECVRRYVDFPHADAAPPPRRRVAGSSATDKDSVKSIKNPAEQG